MEVAAIANGGNGQLDERDIKILTSTEELIGEQGYDRVRLIDIADRSGVSVGSLQHRYRTREGLLRATVERVTTHDLPSLLDPAGKVADPYDRIVALLRHALPLIDPKTPSSLLWLELVVVAARNEELREILDEGNLHWRGAFLGAFEEALEGGRISSDLDAEELTTIVVALIDGYFVQRIIDAGSTDPERQVESRAQGAA